MYLLSRGTHKTFWNILTLVSPCHISYTFFLPKQEMWERNWRDFFPVISVTKCTVFSTVKIFNWQKEKFKLQSQTHFLVRHSRSHWSCCSEEGIANSCNVQPIIPWAWKGRWYQPFQCIQSEYTSNLNTLAVIKLLALQLALSFGNLFMETGYETSLFISCYVNLKRI